MSFLEADLVKDNWLGQLEEMGWKGKVDAVLSIQALHDLGGLAEQQQVLTQARVLLREGGVLAYGDLLFDDQNPHPSRFSRSQHEDMIREAGFALGGGPAGERGGPGPSQGDSTNTIMGGFGCFACYN